jgi:hypothetical protein
VQVDSREYQSRLRADRFHQGEQSIRAFVAFLGTIDMGTKPIVGEHRRVVFERCLLDTENEAFGRAGIKIRTRVYQDRMSCTFKAIDADRYVVAEAPVESVDRKAKTKLEEGIYAFHSTYSRQTTSRQPLGTKFPRVADWALLFPGAARIARLGSRLVPTSKRTIVTRVGNLALDFAGHRVEASLEIGRLDGSEGASGSGADSSDAPIEKIEFSWKDRHSKERYRPEVARHMRRFMQALNLSDWVDLDIHLDKARSDARSELRRLAAARCSGERSIWTTHDFGGQLSV